MNQEVVIIGSGLGGLSAAIRLAKQGFRVQLFEKNPVPGGKMGEFSANGYRFDTGPSVLTMPFVIDHLFASVGENRESHLTFRNLDPICRYFWNDGSQLDASENVAQMQQEMRRFSESDANNYPKFLDYAERIYDITGNIFLQTPVHEMRHLFSELDMATLLRFPQIDPLKTVHSSVARFFGDSRIRQLFDRFATYNGSNPYKAPATLNVIPYVEHGLGAYYIEGGMYRLVEKLVALAEFLGVEMHFSAPVEKIEHDGRQLRGVRVNGELVPANFAVCNADVVTAHNTLIDGFPGRQQSLNRLEPSLSGMVFMWGVRREFPQLAHHNILFSGDYALEFKQIFDEKRAPDDPTIYIAITSKSDAGHAPKGCENWFVLLNMPYLAGQDWAIESERMRRIVLKKLRENGIDVEAHIQTEQQFTPQNFFDFYGSNRGSIYGISSNSPMAAFKRPANRSREINGLYFAGGSSHPGGGIPLVMLSGKMCARLIAEAAGARVEAAPVAEAVA